MLNFIKQLAKQAGEICLNASRQQTFSIESKNGQRDLVTSIDRKVEDFLRRQISRKYPGHAIIGEERGRSGNTDNWYWLLDPIDGTVSFTRNQPGYSISIACCKKGKGIASAVYAPVMDQLFTAEQGRGAWLNGEPIHVSNCTEMNRAILGTGFACMREGLFPNNLSVLPKIMPEIIDIRRMGSAALDLAYVAAGKFDGWWEFILNDYDTAAGVLLVEEAGGEILDFTGGTNYPQAGIIATNGRLTEAIRAFLPKPVWVQTERQ